MKKIRGTVMHISVMANRVHVEGEGRIPILPSLVSRVKVGRVYEFTLEYSPFLNCLAICDMNKVYSFNYLIDLVVLSTKNAYKFISNKIRTTRIKYLTHEKFN